MKTYIKNLYKALIGKWPSGQLKRLDMPFNKCECLSTNIGNYCYVKWLHFFCNRPRGHKGKHFACTMNEHEYAIWN